MKLENINIPLSLGNNPVRNVTFEIRYKNLLSEDLKHLANMFHGKLKERFSNISEPRELEISSVPLNIKISNQKLALLPHYIMLFDSFVITISLYSVSISERNKYSGWENYSLIVRQFYSVLSSVEIFNNTKLRCSIRFVSIFDENIFEENKIKLNLKIIGNDVTKKNNFIVSNWHEDDLSCTLQMSNMISIKDNVEKNSIIDIDVATISQDRVDKFDIERDLNSLHQYEKKVFFNLLNDSFLNDLSPKYK